MNGNSLNATSPDLMLGHLAHLYTHDTYLGANQVWNEEYLFIMEAKKL